MNGNRNELRLALIGDSAHTPPMAILDGLPEALSHTVIPHAPHTIYQELWHIAFWLRITLDWVSGIETPFPATPQDGFPTAAQTAAETWAELCARFGRDIRTASELSGDAELLSRAVQCPSRPGVPTRTMTVEEQLISLAAHNSYHLGRIVLLRQLHGAWPPPAGGYNW